MNNVKTLIVLAIAGLVSACSSTAPVESIQRFAEVPRGASQKTGPLTAPNSDKVLLPVYRIRNIRVDVPKTLVVTESNRYYPGADIVWREDPIGDRHNQVKAIFETAFARGATQINGVEPVDIQVTVERFHALTERARYTVGGVHAITFTLQVRDPKTGQNLGEPKRVRADLNAFGGEQAIRAEQAGQTQKVRITNHLAEVLRQEFTDPGGHATARLGLIQAINKI